MLFTEYVEVKFFFYSSRNPTLTIFILIYNKLMGYTTTDLIFSTMCMCSGLARIRGGGGLKIN